MPTAINIPPRVTILDDSPAVAQLWQAWLAERFGAEVTLLTPAEDWKASLDTTQPNVIAIDATAPSIPLENVCRYIAASGSLTTCSVVLSAGYSDGWETIADQMVQLLGERATVLRKPVSQADFLATFSALNSRRSVSNEIAETIQMKEITPKFALPNESAAARFAWLNQDPAVTAYAIGQADGVAQARGGRDCGDLMQGGAYFRDLAEKIGAEIGLENLRELQAVCDGCRFLSLTLPGGQIANLLTAAEADLSTLARQLTTP